MGRVWERINIGVFMLWVVVLATALLRIGTSRDQKEIPMVLATISTRGRSAIIGVRPHE